MHETEILQKIKEIIRKYLGEEYKIFLFGSRVGDNFQPSSDYDIGIEGPTEIGIGVLAQIKEELMELPIFQKIDIVDFASVDKSFYNVAIKNREWIN